MTVDKNTLNRMRIELDDLEYRIERLRAFMNTEKFFACPLDYRGMCYAQLNAMTRYSMVLNDRIAYLEDLRKEGDN